MEVLRDLARLSSFEPKKGLKRELYFLMSEKHYSRQEAEEYFEKKGKKGQFLVVYKRLKDSLLKSIINAPLNFLPELLRGRIIIWQKHLQTKILLYSEKKNCRYSISKRSSYIC